MKVKSFWAGFAEGVDGAMEALDRQVKKLGDIHIHSVTDTFYSLDPNKFAGSIVRVVVYTPKQ